MAHTRPRKWRVVWGSLLREGFTQVIVDAHDADEAIALASAQHPERFRPQLAFPVDNEFTDGW